MLAARGHVDLIAALADPRTRLVAPVQAAAWVEQYAERHHGLALQTRAGGERWPGFGVLPSRSLRPGRPRTAC